MMDRSESGGSGADGGELAGRPPRPSRRRPRHRLLPAAAAVAVALAGLLGVWVPLHRPAHPVRPPAALPGPSTAAFSMVDSPVTDPALLPEGPLARAALIYARCGDMGAVGGESPGECRYRLVLTDGSQYTLPISAPALGPGSISPDGAFLLVRDTLDSVVLRHLPSGTSRRVTVAGLEEWAGWGPVTWSPGARQVAVVAGDLHTAVAVIDTATASPPRTVDLATVAAAGHYEAGQEARDDPFVVAADGGELSWAHLAETSMTLVHWDTGAQRPRIVGVDVRPHLRPGEILMGSGALLGDGITTAFPVGRAHQEAGNDQVSEAHAILLVDATTGAVRHRQELSTAITAAELHGSGCGLGPDALVLAVHDASQPRADQPTALISLNPWTGARGGGYQLSQQGLFPLIAC